jgi:hypothetical protein
MFGRKWTKAEARVIDYSDRRDRLTGGYVCDYVVDVDSPDRPAFRATIRHRRWTGWQGSTGIGQARVAGGTGAPGTPAPNASPARTIGPGESTTFRP